MHASLSLSKQNISNYIDLSILPYYPQFKNGISSSYFQFGPSPRETAGSNRAGGQGSLHLRMELYDRQDRVNSERWPQAGSRWIII